MTVQWNCCWCSDCGGLVGYGSRGKGRWWAIPAGIVGGAMLGCQQMVVKNITL